MTPDDRETSRQARNRLHAATVLQDRALAELDRALSAAGKSDEDDKHAAVNEAAARLIVATHRVCDKTAELAAIHRR